MTDSETNQEIVSPADEVVEASAPEEVVEETSQNLSEAQSSDDAPSEESLVEQGDLMDGSGPETEEVDEGEWYILQCFSNQEYKVQARIHELVERENLKANVLRILVPEEEVVEIKNNKRLEKVTKIFPGYIFIRMIIEEAVCYQIRRLPGVTQFMGSKRLPTAVTEAEILKVLRKVGDKTKKIDIDFEIDEMIKVITGPFRGYSGKISEISPIRGKLKAMILIFGRETSVELEFDQVEKAVK